MISLVAFLGNTGRQYARTRHNVAWLFADSLAAVSSVPWQQKFYGLYAALARSSFGSEAAPLATGTGGDDRVFVLKPQTLMNLSGRSVAPLAHFYQIAPESILVVHDELELPLGTVSVKWSGGLGGHNGLRSIKAELGTADFWRLRIGIGRPDHSDIAGYVLSPFSADEEITLSQLFGPLATLLSRVLTAGDKERSSLCAKQKLIP